MELLTGNLSYFINFPSRIVISGSANIFFGVRLKRSLSWHFRPGMYLLPFLLHRKEILYGNMGIFCNRDSAGKSLSTSLPCNPFDRIRVLDICLENRQSKKTTLFRLHRRCQGKRMNLASTLQPAERCFLR